MADAGTENPQVKYAWDAPLRPYIKRSSEVIRFYLAVTLIVSIIVILLGDPILLLPIWALLFIFYIFTVTPPEIITNKITKFGIETIGATFRWEILSYFYFTERFGYEVLVIVTHAPEHHHVYLVIPDEKTEKAVVKLLSEHLVFQERPQLTVTDKLIELFSRLVPREDIPKQKEVSQKQAPASP
jgi:hypothetical protein